MNVGDIKKTKKVSAGKYSYHFAPLDNVHEAVLPALNAAGFIVMQPLTYIATGGEVFQAVTTRIIDTNTGQVDESTFPIGDPLEPFQEGGKRITYYRRYALVSHLNLLAEDDDDGISAKSATQRSTSSRRSRRSRRGGDDDSRMS